jgi:ABC-2 type transport system ATP-binding protein
VPVIETRQLIKNYGPIQALGGVTLGVAKGEIFGLLGQNGAGKTTMVKVLLGIARDWQGEAWLLGERAGTAAVRRQVGYLPEDHRFPEYHSGYSLLDYYGGLLSVPRLERRRAIGEMLDMVGMTKRMHSKIRTYSKGMKQRLGVAQALFHDPEVIFLDEPTDGVDPVGRKEIRKMLLRLKERGKTIFLNSHLLGEVELICDRVGILQQGQLVREGTVEMLTRQRNLYTIGIAPGQTFPRLELAAQGYQVQPDGDLWEVTVAEGQTVDPVVDLLRVQGVSIRHLVEKRQTLEDLFLRIVEAAETEGRRPQEREQSYRQQRREPS